MRGLEERLHVPDLSDIAASKKLLCGQPSGLEAELVIDECEERFV